MEQRKKRQSPSRPIRFSSLAHISPEKKKKKKVSSPRNGRHLPNEEFSLFFPSRTFAQLQQRPEIAERQIPVDNDNRESKGEKHLSPPSVVMPFPHLSKAKKNSKHVTLKKNCLTFFPPPPPLTATYCTVGPLSRVVFVYLRPSFASGKTGVNNSEKGLASPFLFLPPPLRD